MSVEGPDAFVVPAPPLSHRRRRLPAILAVIVVVVAGVAVGWAVVRSGGAAAAGDACPTSRPVEPGGSRVPARPSAAVPDDRLVPDAVPDSVLLCEYTDGEVPSGDPEPADIDVDLSRTATLPGSAGAVEAFVARLRAVPVDPAVDGYCISSFSVTTAPNLVALTYADGVVWISTPDLCGAGATNGRAISSADLADEVGLALDRAVGARSSVGPGPSGYGTPPSTAQVEPRVPFWAEACASASEGGTGELLPWAPVSVRICHRTAGGPTAVPTPVGTDHPQETAVALTAQLEALPDDADLSCVDTAPHEQWELLFANAAGDDLMLSVEGGACPSVSNGQAVRVPDAAVFARLWELDPH